MITFYSRPKSDFTDLYLRVREKEHRLLTEAQVVRLPDTDRENPSSREWKLRRKSAARFISYLKKKQSALRILDIGCGNGWFSNALAAIPGTEVTGVDVNLPELELAARVFSRPNLCFAYADLFEETPLLEREFDIVVFNSCFQYFKDAEKILAIADGMLSKNGEIHLIDTPFYKINEVENARLRTQRYYEKLGFPEMAQRYFHHRFADLGKYEIRYAPTWFARLVNDSPFYWIAIEK